MERWQLEGVPSWSLTQGNTMEMVQPTVHVYRTYQQGHSHRSSIYKKLIEIIKPKVLTQGFDWHREDNSEPSPSPPSLLINWLFTGPTQIVGEPAHCRTYSVNWSTSPTVDQRAPHSRCAAWRMAREIVKFISGILQRWFFFLLFFSSTNYLQLLYNRLRTGTTTASTNGRHAPHRMTNGGSSPRFVQGFFSPLIFFWRSKIAIQK